METKAADKPVLRKIKALLSDERLILRETQRAVTPLGGVAVFVAFLHKLGFVEKLRQHMPIQLKSPNHIDPTATFTAFLIAVLAGARRFAHTNWLRGDRALHALLGLSRFPIDDTIRNLFRRFGMGDVHRLFDPLSEWQMERLPQRSGGYSLDLDSTVFERYGEQQGSLKGHNPRQHRHKKCGEGRGGIDLVGGLPLDRHVLPQLLDQPQLVKESYKNRSPAQRGHGTTSLAQNQPLLRQQSADLARD